MVTLLSRIFSFIFLFTILAACGRSPNEELTKELQTVLSWAATVQMTGNAWLQGSVPTSYAKQTLQKARQELQKETDTIQGMSGKAAQVQPQLLSQLKAIGQTTAQLSAAIDQNNHPVTTQQLQQLTVQQQQLKTLEEKMGGQS